LTTLVDHTYDYIVANNIRKLTKSDGKIKQYINLIFGRCFIDVMADYNKKVFIEEVKEDSAIKP